MNEKVESIFALTATSTEFLYLFWCLGHTARYIRYNVAQVLDHKRTEMIGKNFHTWE